jgi:AAA15 family ATPase/GTPase
MLIEFTVGNYLSFKEPVTLSMEAAKAVREYQEDNVIQTPRYQLLRSAVIYGANASGKSNLIKAMRFMSWFVINSSRETQAEDRIGVTPFRLNVESREQTSLFEIVFLINDVKYRYGFEAEQQRIHAEWLYKAEKAKEKELFLRDSNGIKIAAAFPEGKLLENKTRDNALFLSVAAQFNGVISQNILTWFRYRFKQISGLDDQEYQTQSILMLFGKEHHQDLINMLNHADIGVNDIHAQSRAFTVSERRQLYSDIPGHLKPWIENYGQKLDLKSEHNVLDEHQNIVEKTLFDFSDESEGTKKFFYLTGPVIDALGKGTTLVIDELDARLHPLLSRAVVKLFNSKATNPNNAQLIFATHDANLLSANIFRRDQIWFTEKRPDQSSDLYSLVEFRMSNNKKVRSDASFQKDYINGRYGAIPYLGDFRQLFEDAEWQEEPEEKINPS